MKTIASRQNDFIKHVKALEIRKYREKFGEAVLEGGRIVQDAMENDLSIRAVLVDEDSDEKIFDLAERLEGKGIETLKVDHGVFGHLSDTVHSQGILAVVQKPVHTVESVMDGTPGFIVMLDRMQDPGNLGTVIRTADGAGAKCVALTTGSVDAFNPKTLRAAMGSVFHLPILQNLSGAAFLAALKEEGYRIIAADLKKAAPFNKMRYPEKTCLVIGNEGSGIGREILDICDESVKIPIIGRAESLNAAVAAGILLYDIAMKRESSENLQFTK